jgi:FkbM family methyltransferase
MLITVKEIVKAWSIQPSGVIHVGAHAAEESNEYQKYNWKPVTWIEANPLLIDRLREIVPREDVVICAALWDEDGATIDFNIATNGESSSLLAPAQHLHEYPEIHFASKLNLQTKRLDSLMMDVPNFLNLDVQGAELRVLRGMGKLINSLDYIYTEVNDIELYVDCAKLNEIDEFLVSNDFHRICLRRSGDAGWGDALYARSDIGLKKSLKVTLRTFIGFSKFRVYNAAKWLQDVVARER